MFNPKMRKISLTKDVTFLHKSYGEWSKVEKPVMVPKSYEGPDNHDEVKMVSGNNQNNHLYYYVVNNSKSDKEVKENILMKI